MEGYTEGREKSREPIKYAKARRKSGSQLWERLLRNFSLISADTLDNETGWYVKASGFIFLQT